jgi:peptide-methionine (R)-S-oxide reductase
MERKIERTEKEWREILSDEEYKVLREKGTERPFTGIYNDHKEQGNFHCKGCDTLLFTSENKFDSGCGWPSFDKGANKENIEYIEDHSMGMKRVEIVCNTCGGHLGHVFNDGPTVTGLRYCVNSASIDFKED